MNEFGATCSYLEVRRFKQSATTDWNVHGVSSTDDGLVQVIIDNFDADVSSVNGKLSSHALAMIVTQPMKTNETFVPKIPRLPLTNTTLLFPESDDEDDEDYDNNEECKVQKKPQMPHMSHVVDNVDRDY